MVVNALKTTKRKSMHSPNYSQISSIYICPWQVYQLQAETAPFQHGLLWHCQSNGSIGLVLSVWLLQVILPLVLVLAGPTRPAPYCCGPTMPVDTCRWRSNVEGSSLRRSEMFRLNGDESASRVKPRNEPCRSSMSTVACGRWTAYGFSTLHSGTGSESHKTHRSDGHTALLQS